MALLRCTESYAYTDHKSGQNRVVAAGALIDDKDPRCKGREEWFEVIEETAERVSTRPAAVDEAPRPTRKYTKKAAAD